MGCVLCCRTTATPKASPPPGLRTLSHLSGLGLSSRWRVPLVQPASASASARCGSSRRPGSASRAVTGREQRALLLDAQPKPSRG